MPEPIYTGLIPANLARAAERDAEFLRQRTAILEHVGLDTQMAFNVAQQEYEAELMMLNDILKDFYITPCMN